MQTFDAIAMTRQGNVQFTDVPSQFMCKEPTGTARRNIYAMLLPLHHFMIKNAAKGELGLAPYRPFLEQNYNGDVDACFDLAKLVASYLDCRFNALEIEAVLFAQFSPPDELLYETFAFFTLNQLDEFVCNRPMFDEAWRRTANIRALFNDWCK